MDDTPLHFEPDLSSMREVSDTETLISTDHISIESYSNRSKLLIQIIPKILTKNIEKVILKS